MFTRLSVADEINAQSQSAEFVHMDVTSRKDWDHALQLAISTFGGIDILVNNAGWTYRRKDTLTVTDCEYDSRSARAARQSTDALNQESLTSTSKVSSTPPMRLCRIS